MPCGACRALSTCAHCTTIRQHVNGQNAADQLASLASPVLASSQVTIWSRYVEALMSAGETDNVKTVFGRCLMQCPSVDLWFMYLKFIKKVRRY